MFRYSSRPPQVAVKLDAHPKQRCSSTPGRYNYTHVQFWDVASGEMIREIPVPEDTDSLEFLDSESMLVIPREEDHLHQEALILRWNESVEGEASVHY